MATKSLKMKVSENKHGHQSLNLVPYLNLNPGVIQKEVKVGEDRVHMLFSKKNQEELDNENWIYPTYFSAESSM